jgi:hypothetical protein
LEASDILSTIVELSVAIAGFSGVVAALGPNRPADWPPVARRFFSALLGSTAGSAFIALFAMVLLASPLESSTAWGVVSAAHAFFLVGVIVFRVREPRIPGVTIPVWALLAISMTILVLIAQLANALFFRSAWLGVAGVAVYAFHGFAHFISLVRILWGAPHVARECVGPDVE